MHTIEMHDATPEFVECWCAAGIHLDAQVQGGIQAWLKATPTPPFLEHLSFRLGNQLFFVRVEAADGSLQVPGGRRGLLAVAEGCRGHACLMPMKRTLSGGWEAERGGWGLVDARSGAPVDPAVLVTGERIEMTDWELQDFAVQVVRERLEAEGRQLMSWQSNPGVDPSVWFVGDSGRPEWVLVRVARYPETTAEVPDNLADIAAGCAPTGAVGHFAPVTVLCIDALMESDADDDAVLPLWRGHALDAAFDGLEPLWPPGRG